MRGVSLRWCHCRQFEWLLSRVDNDVYGMAPVGQPLEIPTATGLHYDGVDSLEHGLLFFFGGL